MDNLILGALAIYAPIYFLFRRRLFSPLDPAAFMLFTRFAGPLYFFGAHISQFEPYWMWLFFLCSGAFLATFFCILPVYRPRQLRAMPAPAVAPSDIDTVWKFAAFLLLIKFTILVSMGSALPIFSGEGSDAIVDFDRQEKGSSSLLLTIGSVDFALLYMALPFVSGRKRALLNILIFFSALSSVALSKKSAVISLLFMLVVAIYLRQFFGKVDNVWQRREKALLIFLGVAGVAWSVKIFAITKEHFADYTGVGSSLLSTFDYFLYNLCFGLEQFFLAGASFFESVSYSPFTYFFHSFLRIFGLRAFDYNIGEALGYYLTGVGTGAAVNPTFIIEGYVLFGGIGAIIYSAVLGVIVGGARRWIHHRGSPVSKAIFGGYLISMITEVPVDSLYFIKTLFIYGSIVIAFFVLKKLFFPSKSRYRIVQLPVPPLGGSVSR